MTLAGFLLTILPYFAGLVAVDLIVTAIIKNRNNPKPKRERPSTTVARQRPTERLYTAAECRAMGQEYHARRMAERPARVQFVDAETGEVWED